MVLVGALVVLTVVVVVVGEHPKSAGGSTLHAQTVSSIQSRTALNRAFTAGKFSSAHSMPQLTWATKKSCDPEEAPSLLSSVVAVVRMIGLLKLTH